MAKITMKNIAFVDQDASDGITITLIGLTPAGVPPVHKFKGVGLVHIDTALIDLGVYVVAWLVDGEPWQSSLKEIDLPLVVKVPQLQAGIEAGLA